LIDEVDETIGYRWYHFDDHGPFYLNGERLLLRGTHLHEDHAGFGAAMTDELRRKDVEMIKEMGGKFFASGTLSTGSRSL
jgi:beta-galactosidase